MLKTFDVSDVLEGGKNVGLATAASDSTAYVLLVPH